MGIVWRWVGLACGAVFGASGLVVWAAVHVGGEATSRLVPLGVVAVALVAAGVGVGSAEMLAGGVVVVVGMCALGVAVEPGAVAIPVGLAAFLVAEAGFAAVELGPRGETSPTAVAQRRRFLAAVGILSLLLGGLALLAAERYASPNPVAEGLGLLAVAAVGVIVVAVRRRT